MKKEKCFLIDESKLAVLSSIAIIEEVHIQDVLEQAVDLYIDSKTGDPEFQKKFEDKMGSLLNVIKPFLPGDREIQPDAIWTTNEDGVCENCGEQIKKAIRRSDGGHINPNWVHLDGTGVCKIQGKDHILVAEPHIFNTPSDKKQ